MRGTGTEFTQLLCVNAAYYKDAVMLAIQNAESSSFRLKFVFKGFFPM
jgi:hypothetical protein